MDELTYEYKLAKRFDDFEEKLSISTTGYIDQNGNKILHSFDGKPSKKIIKAGITILFDYHKDGVLHRENNMPASYSSVEDHVGFFETYGYYINGREHRTDGGPTSIVKEKTRGKEVYYYHHNGTLHRESGPALISVSKTSKKEVFYLNGAISREGDLPAIIFKGREPKVTVNTYYENFNISRDSSLGPALISKDEFESIDYYIKNGKLDHTYGITRMTPEGQLIYECKKSEKRLKPRSK